MPLTLSDQDLELLLRALCGISARLDRILREPAKADPRQFPPRQCILQELPLDRTPQVIGIGGELTLTWPAVPQGALGVVSHLGINSTDMLGLRLILEINQVPINEFNGIIGAFGSIEDPTAIPAIDLRAGETFRLRLQNTSGLAQSMQVRTKGWFWFPE